MREVRVGDELAGYRIESLIQRGGMAVVFRARHLRMDRMVALKILAPELAGDERFRDRFLREWKLASSLEHPNIINIYDAGEEDGVLFIAMRYVEGTDLSEVIARERVLQPDRALSIVGQVAAALDAAHVRDLIHRDVKPANILIVPPPGPDMTEHVFLADFGLTKHVESSSGLTRTGQFVGTVDYTSPEQIQGKPADGRTDMYALGCVLYECLTGRRPFAKEEDVAVLWAHLNEPPPSVAGIRPGLPVELDAVFRTVLAKDPGERYSTCHEFVAAARAALGGIAPAERSPTIVGTTLVPPGAGRDPHPIQSAPLPAAAESSTRKRLVPIALASVVLVAIVAGAIAVTGGGAKKQPNRTASSASPSSSGSVTPTATQSVAPPAGELSAAIDGITIDGDHYVVEYRTVNYTESLSGYHVHFHYDVVIQANAGEPGKGPWMVYGGPRPFTQAKLADKPHDATRLCILVASPDHSIQPATGNCYPLP